MKKQTNTQFSEELEHAVLDTAVNTANLISILDPMKMDFSEVELVAKATGTTNEYVDAVADLVDDANGIAEAGSHTEDEVREAFSADLDTVYEANFSNLSESIVAYAKNFSENFDAEEKAAEIGAIIGLLDEDKVEAMGEEAVADIISEATNVPADEIEEALDVVAEDFSQNFAAKATAAKKVAEKVAEQVAKQGFGKKIAAAAIATKNAIVTAAKATGSGISTGAKATGSHIARNKKKYIVGGSLGAGTGVGALVVAKKRKNYSEGEGQMAKFSVLYTEEGIPVEFSEPIEVNFNGPFNGPMVEPIAEAIVEASNGGVNVGNSTGVGEEGGLPPQVTTQSPEAAAAYPKPGDKPSDASQALLDMAVKNNLVVAHTASSAAGTVYDDPKFGGPGQENEGKELFSTFDKLVSEIH